ncbi:MAG: thiamine-phosphate kinase [Alphaproteobacteria bacterium]|nr:thiamine-phosphate kinase [Alphaproteobacteria bacterium]
MTDPAGPRRLGEFGRIARYMRPLSEGFAGARGLRDDAAILDPPKGCSLVVTTDTIVAGVHFVGDEGPGDVAAKALRVNLSDLAGMGAQPFCYALNLALPQSLEDAWLEAFCAELAAEQARFGLHLVGGDSVSTPGPVTVTLTAFGVVPAGRALHRDGGEAGDDVWVSGTIGDGLLGLEAVRAHAHGPQAAYLIARYRRPEPRLALGARLVGVARAALDVSDGLIADLAHLAEESGLAAEIAAPSVPLSEAAAEHLAGHPERFADLLTAGDDYELVFAAPPAARADIEAVALETATPVARIGRLLAGAPGAVRALDKAGAVLPIDRTGYRHD